MTIKSRTNKSYMVRKEIKRKCIDCDKLLHSKASKNALRCSACSLQNYKLKIKNSRRGFDKMKIQNKFEWTIDGNNWMEMGTASEIWEFLEKFKYSEIKLRIKGEDLIE